MRNGLDQASLDALSFASHRMAEERVVLLVSARGTVPPAGFERGLPLLLLGPLQLPDAGRLLDAPRPTPPPPAAGPANRCLRSGWQPDGAYRTVQADRVRPGRRAPLGHR